MRRSEKQLCSLHRQRFHDVREAAAAVISFPRIALGILVREDRSHGLEDCFADVILRGDEIDIAFLSEDFIGYRTGYLGVGLTKVGFQSNPPEGQDGMEP